MGTIRIIFLKSACVVSGVSVLQWRSAQAPSAKNKKDIIAVVHTTTYSGYSKRYFTTTFKLPNVLNVSR